MTNGAICSASRAYSSYIAFGSSGSVPNSACAIVFFSWQALLMCVRSSEVFSRSTTRSPLRCILSSYAGPMPRLVVPIFVRPGAFSAASSIIRWYGRITCARFETNSCPSTGSPASLSFFTSLRNAIGIQHHAVADHALALRPQHAARDQLQHKLLARE